MSPSGRMRCAAPDSIEVRGARVHNLKNIDVSVPLRKLVGIAGVSGSGKSSLALGVLYAEGSRRYLEALSTYTRRRIAQSGAANIDDIENVPAALALHQRPSVPGIRSTFGTSTELLNSIRLMFSRLGSHRCPNGHMNEPNMDVALGLETVCPICNAGFYGPGAESFAFNSDGACPVCSGTGFTREVDDSKLVPDQDCTLEEGAVESWNMFGISWMYRVAAELGVRIDVPFKDLSDEEKRIVYEGESVERIVMIPSKNGKLFELNCVYRNAHRSVEEALRKAETEKGLERIGKYLKIKQCQSCKGTRLNDTARSTLLDGLDLPSVMRMTLADLTIWVNALQEKVPEELRSMAAGISEEFMMTADRLMELGLGYLSLDRASMTLSTGERQRVQLARSVRNRTTGVLYVMDEPSIGLHPSNVDGLLKVMYDLVERGNSVVVVDHDVRVLRESDWIIEMGPGAGVNGGEIVTSGSVESVIDCPSSVIGPFMAGNANPIVRKKISSENMFDEGCIRMSSDKIHTVHPLELKIPKNRLTAVTGVSGSGKTTMILESLVPALESSFAKTKMPEHIRSLDVCGIARMNLIDATPIGINIRSTVATYSNVLDDLRRLYSSLDESRSAGLKTGDFSYNTGSLRCGTCDGTGAISLDVQFLPDIETVCPICKGKRYSEKAESVKYRPNNSDCALSLPEIMSLTIDQAAQIFDRESKIGGKLKLLSDLGLDYLTLGESTPELSGGEAQRLKIAAEMGKAQNDAIFIFDEPTIGLHPSDVHVLIGIFQKLMDLGATIVVIDHDLDMIANSDYVIDMGPGGGDKGGRIVAAGTPSDIAANAESITGMYLADEYPLLIPDPQKK